MKKIKRQLLDFEKSYKGKLSRNITSLFAFPVGLGDIIQVPSYSHVIIYQVEQDEIDSNVAVVYFLHGSRHCYSQIFVDLLDRFTFERVTGE